MFIKTDYIYIAILYSFKILGETKMFEFWMILNLAHGHDGHVLFIL